MVKEEPRGKSGKRRGADREPVLGKTLAETARLNRPGAEDARAAAAAVHRANPDAPRRARNRRRLRVALLLLAVLLGLAAWLGSQALG